jgi:SsrA-binding protein
VKSLRDAKVQIADAYARIEAGEVWLHAMHIPPYLFSQDHSGHDPDRKRKLLLHRHEIERLRARVDPEHLSLVPLSIYFKDGRAKVELALAKGRKIHDKRRALAERDAQMDVRRAMARGDRDD